MPNFTEKCFQTGQLGLALSSNYSCLPGFYCPNIVSTNPDSFPQYCPPSNECQIERLLGSACTPQGAYEPVVCKRGSYCPDHRTKIVCPEGYFCPTGSVFPRKCDSLASCPEGSISEVYLGGLIFCLVFDVLLLCLTAFLWFTEKKKRVNVSKLISRTDKEKESEDGVSNDEIIDAFTKALDNQKLRLRFEFKNLQLKTKEGTVILDNVSGKIVSGKLTAIMGPSGCGKTSFVNLLMGKVEKSAGEVLMNNREIKMSRFKKLVGFVPQDDIMIRELTIYENILHAARCRLPASWSNAQIEQHCNTIISSLNLSHVKHTNIGDERTRGISGGQRKRVNIGIELGSVPLALFMDEPTSGLDANTALNVCELLQKISRLGLTIISIIHQPRCEIFKKFDNLLLFIPGGKIVYEGPVETAQSYFEMLGFTFPIDSNPADILMDILSGNANSKYGQLALEAKWKEYTIKREKGINERKIAKSSNQESNLPKLSEAEEEYNANESLSCLATASSSSVPHKSNQEDPPPKAGRTVASMFHAYGDNNHKMEFCILTALKGQRKSSFGAASDEIFHVTIRKICKERGSYWYQQVWWCFTRSIQQQFRTTSSLALEVFVGCLAGALMGISVASAKGELFSGIFVNPYSLVSPAPLSFVLPLYGLLIGFSVALAGCPAGVKVFGEEKLVFWREASSGHSSSAYYLGKSLAAAPRFILSSLHFTSVYCILAVPTFPSFGNMFAIIFLEFYGVYGMSAFVSSFVARENSNLMAVIFGLFAATLCGFGPSLTDAKDWGIIFLWEMSFNKWGSENLYSLSVSNYAHIYDLGITNSYGFTLGNETKGFVYMFLIGSVYRLLAYALLVFLHKRNHK